MFIIEYTYKGENKTYKTRIYYEALRMYNSMLKHKILYQNVKKNFQIPI